MALDPSYLGDEGLPDLDEEEDEGDDLVLGDLSRTQDDTLDSSFASQATHDQFPTHPVDAEDPEIKDLLSFDDDVLESFPELRELLPPAPPPNTVANTPTLLSPVATAPPSHLGSRRTSKFDTGSRRTSMVEPAFQSRVSRAESFKEKELRKSIRDAVNDALIAMSKFWVSVVSPSESPASPPANGLQHSMSFRVPLSRQNSVNGAAPRAPLSRSNSMSASRRASVISDAGTEKRVRLASIADLGFLRQLFAVIEAAKTVDILEGLDMPSLGSLCAQVLLLFDNRDYVRKLKDFSIIGSFLEAGSSVINYFPASSPGIYLDLIKFVLFRASFIVLTFAYPTSGSGPEAEASYFPPDLLHWLLSPGTILSVLVAYRSHFDKACKYYHHHNSWGIWGFVFFHFLTVSKIRTRHLAGNLIYAFRSDRVAAEKLLTHMATEILQLERGTLVFPAYPMPLVLEIFTRVFVLSGLPGSVLLTPGPLAETLLLLTLRSVSKMTRGAVGLPLEHEEQRAADNDPDTLLFILLLTDDAAFQQNYLKFLTERGELAKLRTALRQSISLTNAPNLTMMLGTAADKAAIKESWGNTVGKHATVHFFDAVHVELDEYLRKKAGTTNGGIVLLTTGFHAFKSFEILELLLEAKNLAVLKTFRAPEVIAIAEDCVALLDRTLLEKEDPMLLSSSLFITSAVDFLLVLQRITREEKGRWRRVHSLASTLLQQLAEKRIVAEKASQDEEGKGRATYVCETPLSIDGVRQAHTALSSFRVRSLFTLTELAEIQMPE